MTEQVSHEIENSTVETPAVVTEASDAKMIPQDVVTKTVKTAKHLAYEKGKADAYAQLQAEQAQQHAMQMQTQQAPPMTNAPVVGEQPGQYSPQAMQAMANQAALNTHQQMMQQMQAQQIVTDFQNRMQSAYQDDPTLETQVEQFGINTIPEIVMMTHGVDNTADVIKELVNNPGKIGSLVNNFRTMPRNIAMAEVKKLSDSIKSNQNGMRQTLASEPLSQGQPSVIKNDSGQSNDLNRYSHDYFKAKYRK